MLYIRSGIEYNIDGLSGGADVNGVCINQVLSIVQGKCLLFQNFSSLFHSLLLVSLFNISIEFLFEFSGTEYGLLQRYRGVISEICDKIEKCKFKNRLHLNKFYSFSYFPVFPWIYLRVWSAVSSLAFKGTLNDFSSLWLFYLLAALRLAPAR